MYFISLEVEERSGPLIFQLIRVCQSPIYCIYAQGSNLEKIDPSRIDVINRHKDQLYVITPKTTIMTLNQENRLVYIIDMSSSLATVGNTRSDILLSEVFET